MSHVYKAVKAEEPEAQPTVREMVTKWGDNWRLMWPGTKGGYGWRDRMTFDNWEATQMKFMEKGIYPRVRDDDLD